MWEEQQCFYNIYNSTDNGFFVSNCCVCGQLATISQDMLMAEISAFVHVVLPHELKEISSEAFAGMGAKVIIIPEGCTKIAIDAFDGCDNLKYIVNHSNCYIAPFDEK